MAAMTCVLSNPADLFRAAASGTPMINCLLVRAHQIADLAELAVRQAFERMDVIIHMDPISVLDKRTTALTLEQQ